MFNIVGIAELLSSVLTLNIYSQAVPVFSIFQSNFWYQKSIPKFYDWLEIVTILSNNVYFDSN